MTGLNFFFILYTTYKSINYFTKIDITTFAIALTYPIVILHFQIHVICHHLHVVCQCLFLHYIAV